MKEQTLIVDHEHDPDFTPAVPTTRVASEQVQSVGNLLTLAIEKGMTPESLEKLVALQERVMDRQAEIEFNNALAAFQAECPVVGKNKSANIRTKDGGSFAYGYADLAHVAETIKPLCEKYGFSYSFRQAFEGATVHTICVVRHNAGHSKETTFSGPWESNSAASAMQKVTGATTSARRLALVLAFGLSIGEDRDGAEPHENAERDASQPRTPPRGKREPIKPDDLKGLLDHFKANTENPTPEVFAGFVAKVTGRTFGVMKVSEWTKPELEACWRALTGGGE